MVEILKMSIREVNGSNCKVTEFQSILGLLERKDLIKEFIREKFYLIDIKKI